MAAENEWRNWFPFPLWLFHLMREDHLPLVAWACQAHYVPNSTPCVVRSTQPGKWESDFDSRCWDPSPRSATGTWGGWGAASPSIQCTRHLVESGDENSCLVWELGGRQIYARHFIEHLAGLNKWHPSLMC